MFNKAVAQLSDLFRSMTPAARLTTGLLLVVVVVSLGYLFRYESSGADAYLMNGEPIPPSLIPKMEAAFAKRTWMPTRSRARGFACLAASRPAIWCAGRGQGPAAEFRRPLPGRPELRYDPRRSGHPQATQPGRRAGGTIADHSLHVGDRERLGDDRRRVEDAVWRAAIEDRLRRGQGSRLRALGEDQVKSIRYLVSSAVAGLRPENVTVADLNGGIYHGDMAKRRRERRKPLSGRQDPLGAGVEGQNPRLPPLHPQCCRRGQRPVGPREVPTHHRSHSHQGRGCAANRKERQPRS